MADFIKGLDLCTSFFNNIAKPILENHFPSLPYSAGVIGYGSDTIGFDDELSTDHLWGPRFYLFLDENNFHQKDKIAEVFASRLPFEYKGFPVNF